MAGFTLSITACFAAVLLDYLLGEPRRWHPLVGFGYLVLWIERKLNRSPAKPVRSVALGTLGMLLVVFPIMLVAVAMHTLLSGWLLLIAQILILWLALSLRGLAEHGRAVSAALDRNDIGQARDAVGRIVSRDAAALNEQGVAAAATESMLENGADAVFASLFWFLIAGMPGVILHRLINTLDAMWGYRNDRFLYFGRAAARLDDVMGWLPARLTALTYALLGNRKLALHCWQTQAPKWDSPNAGPVMAAGAGALNIRLGGPTRYNSGLKQRSFLGGSLPASAASVEAAVALVRHGVWLWLGVFMVVWALSTAVEWPL